MNLTDLNNLLPSLIPALGWLLAQTCEHAPWALSLPSVLAMRALGK
ncbi:MAG: hypothetical protein AAGJ52_14375 [Pseudomonadota bacterium]